MTTFSAARHERFAHASGDFNPIHMDPIAARRTQAGEQLVHGIHSLLQLLDHLACQQHLPPICTLKAQFRQPIYVGDVASVEIIEHAQDRLKARMLVDGSQVLVSTLGFKDVPAAGYSTMTQDELPRLNAPAQATLELLEGYAGRIPFADTITAIAHLFPSAAEYLGARQAAALACSSYLVGMVAPGLHSIYRGIEVTFTVEESSALNFIVSSVDPRFRVVRLQVQGGGIAGSIDTLYRSPPVEQPTMAAIAQRVDPEEFRGSHALIVGGSRGLGELTAKIIAAGGGHVLITYARGKSDAENVTTQIRSAGGDCDCTQYDVRAATAAFELGFDTSARLTQHAPTHLYYFATPPIARRKAGLVDRQRLAEFNEFYVTAFLRLVQACQRRRPSGLRVFYPSSIFVESRPLEMTEYAMAKAAAEVLCADLQRTLKIKVMTPRLPRLPTDQTNGVTGQLSDPVDVMLPLVRQMHSNDLKC